MLNLEPMAAQAAATMTGADPNTAENMITKALMVLSEQGIYALGLFLCTRRRDMDLRAAADIHRALRDLLAKAGLAEAGDRQLEPGYYRELTGIRDGEQPAQSLQRVLLTKQLLETTLTYGRYHAKALKG